MYQGQSQRLTSLQLSQGETPYDIIIIVIIFIRHNILLVINNLSCVSYRFLDTVLQSSEQTTPP